MLGLENMAEFCTIEPLEARRRGGYGRGQTGDVDGAARMSTDGSIEQRAGLHLDHIQLPFP